MKSGESEKHPVTRQAGKHNRFPFLVILVFCTLAGCRQTGIPPSPIASPDFTAAFVTDTRPKLPTPTSSPTLRRTPSYTLPPPSSTSGATLPNIFEQLSAPSGMDPYELMAVYTAIHDALGANDPKPLAELVHYPLIGCNRCSGLVIETPDDFLQAYPDLMDEETRLRLSEQQPEDLMGNWHGVMFGSGELWLGDFCEEENFQSCTVHISKFGNYCQFWFDWKISENLPVNASNFAFGRYTVESYETVGGTMLKEEDIKAIVNSKINIFPTRYLADPSGWFGDSCQTAVIEFCPAYHDKWNDPSSVGRLNILCKDEFVEIFDVLAKDRIGWYADGRFFYLQHQET